jgi:hypothetical protein
MNSKDNEGYLGWVFNPLGNHPTATWCEPIPKDNAVWGLIAQLEAGENPQLAVGFGRNNEYKRPERRA